MSNNNTLSVLFELQKNLEDLSSAKEQVDFFRDKSLEITDGISEVQRKYVEHLQSIKTDYQNRVDDLKIELASFLSKTGDDNFNAIQRVVDKSEEIIGKGIEQFKSVASEVEVSFEITKEESKTTIQKVVSTADEAINTGVEKFTAVAIKIETSNDEKILAISELLENYKNVVEASNSLIETLTAIDFPTKLDALSSKSHLIIESITSAKQALEIKLTESQSSVIEKNNTAKEQIIQSNDSKINSLSEKIVEANNGLKTTLSNKFEEQSKQNNNAFDNLNSLFEKQLNQTNERLNKQDKEISTLKMLLFIAIGVILIGIILNFVMK